MSPTIALHNSIFQIYLVVVAALLLIAGAVIFLLQKVFHKKLARVWLTYRSWLIMTPIIAATIFLGRGAVIAGVAVLSIAAFKEYARATGLFRDWWMTGTVYLAIAGLGFVAWMNNPFTAAPGWFGLFMAMPVIAVIALSAIPIIRNRAAGQFQALALSVFGFIYIGWMFGHLGYLANLKFAYDYLCFILLATELNDIAGFTCGKLFGRRLLRGNISPGKTWAGAIGAMIISMLLPWALRFSLPQFSRAELICTGAIVGIFAPLGDLCISLIKRDIGIKDMGGAIPGHGGILDRIDSLLFVAPLFLHMIHYFNGFG